MSLEVELAEVREFLAEHAPFSALSLEDLTWLVGRLTVRYFRRGSAIMAPGQDNNSLYAVRSGAVEIRDRAGVLVDRGSDGMCFGATTLLGGNPSQFSATAIEDSLTLVMDAATFARLGEQSAEFAEFFDVQRSARMGAAIASQQLSHQGSAILKTRTAELATRAPVGVPLTATIREGAVTMAEHGVSALLVMDGPRLAGLVTDRDLRTRVLAAGVDPAEPITRIMTANPLVAPPDGMAVDLLLDMVGRNIHHLPIVADGVPMGMVTATDLMRLERDNPVYLAGDVAKQPDAAGVAGAAARLPAVVSSLVAQDASAADIGRIVTSIGDAVDRRLLALAHERLGPAPVPYCWVTLGSRARREQALAADQDNALIIADEAGPAEVAWFEGFAELMVGWLAEAGYPRCAGDVMATNPRWRVRLADWRTTFRGWLQEPEPDAVLGASIFFDMRPVAGDSRLYDALVAEVRALAPESRRFLAHLSRSAVLNEPPLGFFRGFVLAREGDHKDTLDIKRGGVGAVVDLARVYALAIGSTAVSTDARLAAAIQAGAIAPERGADLRDAFEFISYVRFRHQAAAVQDGRVPDNRLSPAELSAFDKRHLREAFAIVRSAQSTLATLRSGSVS